MDNMELYFKLCEYIDIKFEEFENRINNRDDEIRL